MTKIRLYLDEDTMDSDLLAALRRRTVDVISTVEAEMLSRSDEEQLQWALKHQRVIYSFNVRDFYRIHTKCNTKSALSKILGLKPRPFRRALC